LRDHGYPIVVVTNQPGIGMGYFSKEEFFTVNRELLKAAAKIGLEIDRVYFCPHNKADHCYCRKPSTGMIARAEREMNIDVARSFVVGDMTLDLELARAAGCRSVLVHTGRGGKDGNFSNAADISVADLGAAADAILALDEKICAIDECSRN